MRPLLLNPDIGLDQIGAQLRQQAEEQSQREQKLKDELNDQFQASFKGLSTQMHKYLDGLRHDQAVHAQLCQEQIRNVQAATPLSHATPSRISVVNDVAPHTHAGSGEPSASPILAVTRSGNYKNDPRDRPPTPIPAMRASSQHSSAPRDIRKEPYSGQGPATPFGTRGTGERDAQGRNIPYSGFAMNNWDIVPSNMRKACAWDTEEDYKKDLRVIPCKYCGQNHYTGHCHGAYCYGKECQEKWGEARAAVRRAQVDAFAAKLRGQDTSTLALQQDMHPAKWQDVKGALGGGTSSAVRLRASTMLHLLTRLSTGWTWLCSSTAVARRRDAALRLATASRVDYYIVVHHWETLARRDPLK